MFNRLDCILVVFVEAIKWRCFLGKIVMVFRTIVAQLRLGHTMISSCLVKILVKRVLLAGKSLVLIVLIVLSRSGTGNCPKLLFLFLTAS